MVNGWSGCQDPGEELADVRSAESAAVVEDEAEVGGLRAGGQPESLAGRVGVREGGISRHDSLARGTGRRWRPRGRRHTTARGR